MTRFIRTDSANADFIALVSLLDKELAARDGSEHAFYAQFNKIDALKQVIVAYADREPVGCGAIKEIAPQVAEVKRMYTRSGHRGMGIAAELLGELEYWASELGMEKCVLETGLRQPEAIALYVKCGYTRIPNYGQYAGIANSVCFEKRLRQPAD